MSITASPGSRSDRRIAAALTPSARRRLATLSIGIGTLSGCGHGSETARDDRASAAAQPSPARAYGQVCANCHLDSGKGMPPAYRSLVGSRWATGNPDRTIAIVLFGVQGPVVDGAYTYHTSMLPYGSGATMADADVAAAITHVRTSWGNAASPVTAEDIARVRAAFPGRRSGFTQAELDAMGISGGSK